MTLNHPIGVQLAAPVPKERTTMNLKCQKCTRKFQIENAYFSKEAGKFIRDAHSTAWLQKDVPSQLQCVCGNYLV